MNERFPRKRQHCRNSVTIIHCHSVVWLIGKECVFSSSMLPTVLTVMEIEQLQREEESHIQENNLGTTGSLAALSVD